MDYATPSLDRQNYRSRPEIIEVAARAARLSSYGALSGRAATEVPLLSLKFEKRTNGKASLLVEAGSLWERKHLAQGNPYSHAEPGPG